MKALQASSKAKVEAKVPESAKVEPKAEVKPQPKLEPETRPPAASISRLNLGYKPKFKWIAGKVPQKQDTYFNLRPDVAALDSQLVVASESRFAVPWQGGGGPVYIGQLKHQGKLEAPSQAPVINGHKGPVLTLAFANKGKTLITGSDDCTIRAYRLPNDPEAAMTVDFASQASSSAPTLKGHLRPVKVVEAFDDRLASASSDGTIRIWDVAATSETLCVSDISDVSVSLDWNAEGSLLAIASRDKRVSVVDSRSGTIASSFAAHAGTKPIRARWLPGTSQLVTCGFGRTSARELFMWDMRRGDAPIATAKLPSGSGQPLPHVVRGGDNGGHLVVVGFRGESTVAFGSARRANCTSAARIVHLVHRSLALRCSRLALVTCGRSKSSGVSE